MMKRMPRSKNPTELEVRRIPGFGSLVLEHPILGLCMAELLPKTLIYHDLFVLYVVLRTLHDLHGCMVI